MGATITTTPREHAQAGALEFEDSGTGLVYAALIVWMGRKRYFNFTKLRASLPLVSASSLRGNNSSTTFNGASTIHLKPDGCSMNSRTCSRSMIADREGWPAFQAENKLGSGQRNQEWLAPGGSPRSAA